MRALQHVQVENVLPVQSSEVHCFTRYLPEILKHRTADFSKRSLIADAGAQADQLWSDEIRSCIVTEQVALELKMGEEAVRGALVDPGSLRNILELQPLWRRVQSFEHPKNFGNTPDRSRFRLPCTNHEHPHLNRNNRKRLPLRVDKNALV